MLTFKKLPQEVIAEMERLGRLQGIELAEVEQQYNDAQVAIHGNPDSYGGNALMRGFKKRGKGAKWI